MDARIEISIMLRISTQILSLIKKHCPLTEPTHPSLNKCRALHLTKLQHPQATVIQKSPSRTKTLTKDIRHPCCHYSISSVLAGQRVKRERQRCEVDWDCLLRCLPEQQLWSHWRVLKNDSGRARACKEAAWGVRQVWAGGRG